VVEEDSQDALVCGIKWTLLGRYPLAELVNLILANAARQGHSSDSALLQGGSDEDERHGSPHGGRARADDLLGSTRQSRKSSSPATGGGPTSMIACGRGSGEW
jgi:hypothetical protein